MLLQASLESQLERFVSDSNHDEVRLFKNLGRRAKHL